MNQFKFLWICLICAGFSCKPDTNSPEISFYYWKTIFKLNDTEKSVLKEYKVKSLYIRYFDVDINKADNQPYPISTIRFDQSTDSFEVIPVIYIKNKVMLQKKINLDSLTINILSYINQINSSNKINCNEIQIDCDWTLDSRDNFLKFMQIIKKQSKKKLSVTIRLHQVKYYAKTKVPEADYGVLMYYNMGTISVDSLNSIYDQNIALKYINSLKTYPLQLDVALPVFSQGVQIENKKVSNLISKVDVKDFISDTNYVQLSRNQVFVKNANFKFGYYFKQNDEIKMESISFDQLKEMAEDLDENLKDKPKHVIFFDLDSINLKHYQNENQNFNKIIDCF
jgi:hypothetical protein